MKEESQIQFDFTGSQLRDAGIELAESHANAVHENWSDRAFEMFKEWLKGWPKGYKFLIEDVRKSLQISGLPEPPHKRAYGGMALKARKSGLIRSLGTTKVKNPQAHCANANLWEKI